MGQKRKIAIIILPIIFPIFLYSQDETFVGLDVQPYTGNMVIIQWKVIPKADSLIYEVERSTDTVHWSKFARISSNLSHQYFSIDTDPNDGITYYRIRRLVNGTNFSCSEIKWVQVNKVNELYIWPNPAKNVLNIRTPFTNGSMEIVDPGGKLMIKSEITNYTTSVFTDCLSKGIYFIKIRNGNEVFVEKFIKV